MALLRIVLLIYFFREHFCPSPCANPQMLLVESAPKRNDLMGLICQKEKWGWIFPRLGSKLNRWTSKIGIHLLLFCCIFAADFREKLAQHRAECDGRMVLATRQLLGAKGRDGDWQPSAQVEEWVGFVTSFLRQIPSGWEPSNTNARLGSDPTPAVWPWVRTLVSVPLFLLYTIGIAIVSASPDLQHCGGLNELPRVRLFEQCQGARERFAALCFITY